MPCSVRIRYVRSRSLDSWVHRSRSSSVMPISPKLLSTLDIRPDLPTAFFIDANPCCTTSFPPTTPATELVTLPSRLYVVLTAFLPVCSVFASVSTVSMRGYTTGTEIIQIQCCTLGGSSATLGNRPWYVGPASTRACVRSDRQSGPTTTIAGPRYLTKCQPAPVIVNRSWSVCTLRRISIVVWCWNSKYISMAMRPMFLKMDVCCMYAGYEPKPSNLQRLLE